MSVIGVFLLLSCCGFLFLCCLSFYLLALSVVVMGRGGYFLLCRGLLPMFGVYALFFSLCVGIFYDSMFYFVV